MKTKQTKTLLGRLADSMAVAGKIQLSLEHFLVSKSKKVLKTSPKNKETTHSLKGLSLAFQAGAI